MGNLDLRPQKWLTIYLNKFTETKWYAAKPRVLWNIMIPRLKESQNKQKNIRERIKRGRCHIIYRDRLTKWIWFLKSSMLNSTPKNCRWQGWFLKLKTLSRPLLRPRSVNFCQHFLNRSRKTVPLKYGYVSKSRGKYISWSKRQHLTTGVLFEKSSKI